MATDATEMNFEGYPGIAHDLETFRSALRAAHAALSQPVQFTNSTDDGAARILRADCSAARSHIEFALSSVRS